MPYKPPAMETITTERIALMDELICFEYGSGGDGVPADINLIMDAYDDNNFWLPSNESPDVALPAPPHTQSAQLYDVTEASAPAATVVTPIASLNAQSSHRVMGRNFSTVTQYQNGCQSQHSPAEQHSFAASHSSGHNDDNGVDPIASYMTPLVTASSNSTGTVATFGARPDSLLLPPFQVSEYWTPTDPSHNGDGLVDDTSAAQSRLQAVSPLRSSGHSITESVASDHAEPPNDATTTTQFAIPQQVTSTGSKRKVRELYEMGTTIRGGSTTTTRPVKALTAYNYFFRFERERLLKDDLSDDNDPSASGSSSSSTVDQPLAHYHWTPDTTRDFQRQVLENQWQRDPTVKRKHCKTHGRITFHDLSKRISAGWKDLPEPAKDVFREIAALDSQRYVREMNQRGPAAA